MLANLRKYLSLAFIWVWSASSPAIAAEQVVDIPTRSGVTQRFLYISPDSQPRAAAILFTGGHGGLSIFPNGSIAWAERSFLARNRSLFAQQGIAVALIDAPSDRRSGLSGFRHTAEHAADIGAVISWLRARTAAHVWLLAHSRGTESAVASALHLGSAPAGPDGLVLTSSILTETMFVSGKAIPQFPLDKLTIPLFILHHEADTCAVTRPEHLPKLIAKLPETLPRKLVKTLAGGQAPGSACEMDAHHSYAGQDDIAVGLIVDFMLNR